jgi:hypothetical protein
MNKFFSILGLLLMLFAAVDFILSIFHINITPFMGILSRYSPLIFGLIGGGIIKLSENSDKL